VPHALIGAIFLKASVCDAKRRDINETDAYASFVFIIFFRCFESKRGILFDISKDRR